MAKRFTDTNKYKKPFIRGLQGAYKVLWDYLYHDCDHAGIWIVDFDIAQIYVGDIKKEPHMKINKHDALEYFNKDEIRIIEIDNESKWFIPSFIEFQYGELNQQNRAHNSVIKILSKYNLYKNNALISPLQGAKDKDKYKDKYKETDSELLFETFWDSYHLKTKLIKSDKIPAEKHWKKLTEAERQKAIDNIQPYYDSIKDKKFIKKARTYLSDKNFNDEFTIIKKEKKETFDWSAVEIKQEFKIPSNE